MKYINSQTNVVRMHFSLCDERGIVFPKGTVYENWHPVHETEIQAAPSGYHMEIGPVVLEGDGKYYQTYIAVEDTATPQIVPVAVEPFQGKAILIADGLYGIVEAFIMNPEVPDIYRAAWVSAKMWERDSVFVNNMLAMLGKNKEAGDDMFIRAANVSLTMMAN